MNGRLLSPEEYDAALATPGVEAAPAGTWEWVDAAAAGDKKAVRAPGKKATRPQTGQKDVTFRLLVDVVR
jgi:hypothetical protein